MQKLAEVCIRRPIFASMLILALVVVVMVPAISPFASRAVLVNVVEPSGLVILVVATAWLSVSEAKLTVAASPMLPSDLV